MSDNTTLVEQLNLIAEDCQRGKEARYYLHDRAHATYRDVELACTLAAARIAELEAALASYDAGKSDREKLADERIAELEAEVARYEADLEDPTLSVGEAYAYRSEDHGPGKRT